MLALVGLVILSVSTFVQHVTGLGVATGIAIAAAATAPMLFMYSVACYFLGHVLVIAIMPVVALLVIEMTRRWTLRELLPCCAALGLTLWMMLFSYAPSILTVPVFLQRPRPEPC